jgi:site-specific recombinase XerD
MATLAQTWFEAYTARREEPLSESSRRVYGAWWNRYVCSLEERGRTPVCAAVEDVRAFLSSYDGNTPIRYCRLIKDVYDAALAAGLAKVNPVAEVEAEYTHKEEERVPVPAVTLDVVQALYSIKPTRASWKGLRDRALVLLSADAGLRRHELLNLQLKDRYRPRW